MKFKKGQHVRATTWDEYTGSEGVIKVVNADPVVPKRTRYAVKIDNRFGGRSTALFYEEELEVIE